MSIDTSADDLRPCSPLVEEIALHTAPSDFPPGHGRTDAENREYHISGVYQRTLKLLRELLSPHCKAQRRGRRAGSACSAGSATRSSQGERIVSPKAAREFSAAYSVGKFLGRGSYGVVRECISRRTGRTYACKVIRKEEMRNRRAEEAAIRREVEILQQLAGHPHVVSLVDVFEDRAAIFVVMEKCNGGELYDLLCETAAGAGSRANDGADDARFCNDASADASSVSSCSSSEDEGDGGRFGESGSLRSPRDSGGMEEQKAAAIFKQVVRAVELCHASGILHRDLKLENILLCFPETAEDLASCRPWCFPLVKLADFGSAVSLPPGQLASGVAGSRLYQAPEVLQQCKYGFKADMWSLGVVLFSLLSGSLPFMAHSRRSQTRLAKKGVRKIDSSAWEGVSPEAKELVTRLLAVEPNQRPSAEEVLQDPWIVKFGRQQSST
ncbi:hypothetical protein CLOM_g3834 [Closterium sp. NIES-68]|nr:hypothetical protein CLOM_g3834 [Closterium sp. NIES-68]GJP68147.1 hypothetical protein CLOP_g24887 [Closterium sp. NIES-67]